MGKKNNKKPSVNSDHLFDAMFGDTESQAQHAELTVHPAAIPERDAEGFLTLGLTPEGETQMEKIRASKKTGKAQKLVIADEKPAWEVYDGAGVTEILNKAIGFIKDGKFGKAFADHDSKIIEKFLEVYDQIPKEHARLGEFNDIAKNLLVVCKSYFEYDDKHRQYLTDNQYDKVLAKFIACGGEEPTGIATGRTKTAIKYPSLHNNMDKAYILNSTDQIPNGVKETDSIEAFLLRCYKALGLTSESELTLEISPKIDGVSVNGTISGDMLKDPQTRGDYDESVALPGMSGIQVGDGDKIADSEFGIQYECFVTEEDRIKASQYLGMEVPYVSCRHAASGITQRLSVKEDDNLLQFLSFYPIATEGLEGTYDERMDFIQNFGIMPDDMIPRKKIKGDMKQLIKEISKLRDDYKKRRDKLTYMIDGIVITIPDDDHQKAIGRTGRTNQFQIALKFDPETAEGVVKGIHLDTGKKGYRTIQVDLENPVFIGGVKYDHVPVLSANIFKDMKLRVGSKVKVFRTGDVIPSIQVTEAGTNSLIELPTKCPICNQLLDIKSKKLFCGNYECRGNQMGRLVGYLKGIGVEGYDETALQNVIDGHMKRTMGNGFFLVTEPIDLYKLTSDEKFYPALLEATRTCPDYRILGSIGIPDLGPERAKIIIKTAGGFKKMADFWYDKRNLLDGIIKTLPASIAFILSDMMKSPAVGNFLNRITKYMENFTTDWSDKILVGHTGYTPTTQVIEICKKEGFEITDGKKFDLLITGDFSSKSDKMTKAIEKNIPIYSEASFIDRYDDTISTHERYDLIIADEHEIDRGLNYDPVI